MAITSSTVDIYWEASTDNIAVIGYDVYVNGVFNKTVGNVLETTVTGLQGDTSYTFTVRAFDAALNYSLFSNAEVATTLEGVTYPLDGLTSYKAAYSFRRLTSNAVYYCRIRRASDGQTADVLVDEGVGAHMDWDSITTSSGKTVSQFANSSIVTVAIWYDQIGSANMSGYSGAVQDYPHLSPDGATFYGTNGIPAMKFDGISDGLKYEGALGLTGGTAKNGAFLMCMRDNLTQTSNTSVAAYGNVTTGGAGEQNRLSIDSQGYGWRCNAGNSMYENLRFPEDEWSVMSTYSTGTMDTYDKWKCRVNKADGLRESFAQSSTYNLQDNGATVGCAVISDGTESYFFEGYVGEYLIYDGDLEVEIPTREAEMMTVYNIPSADIIPPTAPSNLVGVAGDTTASLTWSPSSDAVGVTQYQIYRDGVQIGTSTITSYTDTGRTNGVQYSYYVTARDLWQNYSAQSNTENVTPSAGADTENPVMGTVSLGTTGSTTQVINWTAATDNVAISGYFIQWRLDSGSYGATTDVGNVLTYEITALNNGGHYWARVQARDTSGNYSAWESIEFTLNDTEKPIAPVLSFSSKTDTTVTVTWTAGSDNVDNPVPFHLVFKDGGWVSPTLGEVYTYTYTGLTPNTNYDFNVRNKDHSNNQSLNSNTVNVTTDPSGVSVTSVSMTGSPETNSSNACSNITTTTRYTDGNPLIPQVGDVIYTDSGGTTTFNGANSWWKMVDAETAVYISTSGVITSTSLCI